MGSASRRAPSQNGRILRRVTHALPTPCALHGAVSSTFTAHNANRNQSVNLTNRLYAPTWHARHLADHAVLHFDKSARRGVAVQSTKFCGRHLAVRCSRPVFVVDVKQHEAALDFLFLAAHSGLILFNPVVISCVFGGLSGFVRCLAFCRILFTTLQLLLLLLRFGAIAVTAFLLVVGFEGHRLLSMATDYSNTLAGRIVVSICASSYCGLE